MKKIEISTEYIKLDSLLKLAGVTATGGEAKNLINSGGALLNGETCTQRGKKIRPGDVVTVQNTTISVVKQEYDNTKS
jgi:ribosome-associated protein